MLNSVGDKGQPFLNPLLIIFSFDNWLYIFTFVLFPEYIILS